MNDFDGASCDENVEATAERVADSLENGVSGVSEPVSGSLEVVQQERCHQTSPDSERCHHQISPGQERNHRISGQLNGFSTSGALIDCNLSQSVREAESSDNRTEGEQYSAENYTAQKVGKIVVPPVDSVFQSTLSRLLPSLERSVVDRFKRSLLADRSINSHCDPPEPHPQPHLQWSQSLPEDLSQESRSARLAAASRLLLPFVSASGSVQPLQLTTGQRQDPTMNKNSDLVNDSNPNSNSIPAGASTMPIRYVLEFLDAPVGGAQELDKDHEDYAIIATSTPISQLKSALLSKCGLEHLADHECSVYVCVRNWRRLPLESVTSGDPDRLTVADMFTTVSNCVTLRLVCSWSAAVGRVINCLQKRLLKLCLQLTSGSEQLQRLGCPLDQSQLNQLLAAGSRTFPLEAAAKFNQWYDSVTQSSAPADNGSHGVHNDSLLHRSSTTETSKLERPLSASDATHATMEEPSPVQLMTRPRMRTTFDIEYEMPKLQKWFSLDPHPSRAQMHFYTDQLNAYRQAHHRRPLEVTNILYWFKNARAAHKKLDSARTGDESAVNISSGFERGCHGDESSGASSSSTSDREPEDPVPTSLLKIEHCDSDSETEKESVNGATGMEMVEYENGDHVSPQSQDRIPSADQTSAVNFGLPGSYMGPMGLSYGGVNPAMFRQSMSMYMSGCLTGLQGYTPPTCTPSSFAATPSVSSYALDQLQRKRNRTFIDPVSEVPMLERWFLQNTHPCHTTILRYTDELNRQSYRQKFPRLEPKNVQFWFKNRRAKTKRLRSGSLTADCGLFPQKVSKVDHPDQQTGDEI